MRLTCVIATLLAALAIGCGDGETAPAAPSQCQPPTRLVGDRCLGPGVADDGCPAGTLGLADGSCRPAGMLAEDCAEGFVHVPFDEQIEGASYVAGSCEPILPAAPCGPGQMAVPGDTACRPIMDCGSGKWGDIPIDAATVYVDQSFGGMSDGSAAAPWTSIGQAVAAASPGALIAIAAGSYAEDVNIIGKPLRLWGVCPDQVELVGTGIELDALDIRTGANGSEVRGLAVRGAAWGVSLSGSEQVLFDRLWVHDNAGRGIDAQGDFGPTSFTLRASLVEQNHATGVIVAGSEATVEATVVRGTLPNAQGLFGYGIGIQLDLDTGAPSVATVRASLLAHNHEHGVFVAASEATLEATVVRGTLANAQGLFGRGIGVQPHPVTGAPSPATVRASLFEQNHEVGVFVAASGATVEATVVRGTLPNALGLGGRGIDIQLDLDTGAPSVATVRASLLAHNHDLGLVVAGSDAHIETCLIVATQPNGEGLFGDGLLAISESAVPTHAFIDATRIGDSARAGLSTFGASVSLGATAIGCAAFELEGEPYLGAGFIFEDRGGNGCGCPEPSGACVAVSTGLESPEPIASIE